MTSGVALVNHIKTIYQTETVNLVVNTHPHQDHTAGLTAVLSELEVDLLLMHLPWEHSSEILNLFHDGRITSDSLADRIKRGLQATHDLYELSLKREVPVAEPFPGCDTGSPYIQILGPSREFYQGLVPQFTSTPRAVTLSEALETMFAKGVSWVKEALNEETLVDPVAGTNAENNSSAITFLSFGRQRMLFTADAGLPALERACDYAESQGISMRAFSLVQIPHHGSKRNIGPSILNRMIGEIGSDHWGSAIASVPATGEPKHPSKRVLNAFTRRGASVITTKDGTVCHSSGGVSRPNWRTIEPLPLFSEVEDEDL